jgi:hypothetical protein
MGHGLTAFIIPLWHLCFFFLASRVQNFSYLAFRSRAVASVIRWTERPGYDWVGGGCCVLAIEVRWLASVGSLDSRQSYF